MNFKYDDKFGATHLFGPKRQSHFLLFVVELEDSVLDFVAPQQFVALKVFDAIVGRDKLTHTRLANVAKILFGFIPCFRDANFKQT